MADVSITPASVLAGSKAVTKAGIAGASITAGQVLYKDASDSNKLKLADANGAADLRVVEGIALHAAASGQPLKYVISDSEFTPGFTTAIGEAYMLASDTAGAIAPVADVAGGDYVTVLGVGGPTTSKMVLNITAAGGAHASPPPPPPPPGP